MKAIDKTIKQSESTAYTYYEEVDPRFSASRGEWVIRAAGWVFIVVSCIAIIWLAV